MKLNAVDIEDLERKYRLNLINSLTGIKPANLIGTRSKNGQDNVAIFSSVVHLGSNPAQIGFVLRPQPENPTDTYANILETQVYTVNSVAEQFTKKAHYTSAKLEKKQSEFTKMAIEKEFINDFHAPFVKASPIKIGVNYLESITLPNGCKLIIGSIVLVAIPDKVINNLGQIDLAKTTGTGISGLNTYYSFNKIATYPYVRTDDIPDFE